MKALRKKRMQIIKYVLLGVSRIVFISIVTLLELIFRYNIMAVLMRLAMDYPAFPKMLSFDLIKYVERCFYNVKKLRADIKFTKKELKKEKEEKKCNMEKEALERKTLKEDKSDVLKYITLLVKKSEQLGNEVGINVLLGLKKILNEYNEKYTKILQSSNKSERSIKKELLSLEKSTLQVLKKFESLIEGTIKTNTKMDSFKSRKDKVLSLIDSKTEEYIDEECKTKKQKKYNS